MTRVAAENTNMNTAITGTMFALLRK